MNSLFVYAVAALAAASTLYGVVRFLARRAASGGAASGGVAPHRDAATCGAEVSHRDAASRLEILGRTRMGMGRALVVVQFENRRILLGVAGGQWTALADLGRAPGEQDAPVSSIEAELNRVMNADRFRRGRRAS